MGRNGKKKQSNKKVKDTFIHEMMTVEICGMRKNE